MLLVPLFAMDHATESKHLKNLIEARQRDEDDFAYIISKQKMYNMNIWVYTPCGGGKVEIFKPADDSDKDLKDVRILAWGDGTTEHTVLIKNIETLLDQPNRMNHKFFYCGRCTYCFDSLNTTNMNVTTPSNPRLFVL